MKSVERFHTTLNRSILHLSNFKNSNFLPKLINIYVLSILLLSVVFIPTSLVINAGGEEEEDDREDNDGEEDWAEDSKVDNSKSSIDTVVKEGNSGSLDSSGDGGNTGNDDTSGSSDGVNVDSGGDMNDVAADVDSGSDAGNTNNVDMSNTENNQGEIVGFGSVSDGVNVDSGGDMNDVAADVDEVNNSADESGMKDSTNELKENLKEDTETKHEDSKKNKPSITDNKTIKKFVFNKTDNESSNSKMNTTEKPNIEKSFESNIGEVNENEKISVETPNVEKTKTCIQKVDFTPSKHQKNVKLQVSNIDGKPDEVQKDLNISNTSKVYKYLDIKLTSNKVYIGETGIKNMTFSFSVEKSWIENQSFDKFTVKMMRYHDNEWQELNTSYTNETEDFVYYNADTPGLSIFAVVGNKVVEDSDEIVVESTNMPWWMPFSVIIGSTATLGVVLFKKRFVYNP